MSGLGDALLDHWPLPAVVVNVDGVVDRSNPLFEELFEISTGQLDGRGIDAFLQLETAVAWSNIVGEYTASGLTRLDRVFKGVTSSGRSISVELGLTRPKSDDRSSILVTVFDVSGRTRQDSLAALTFQAAASAMITVDKHGTIRSVNPAASLLFGYARSEIVGNKIESLIPAEFRASHTVVRDQFSQASGSREMGRGQEIYGQRKSGETFRLEVALTRITLGQERLTLATIVDITERLAAERALAEKEVAEGQAERLKEINEELSRYAYAASHDLKAPLSTIAGMIECCLMDLGTGATDEVERNLLKLRRLCERSGSRIESALAFAKVGHRKASLEQVNLREIAQEMWDDCSLLHAQAVGFDNAAPAHLQVRTGPAQIRAIIGNLFSNAVKYRDIDKGKCWVSFDAHKDDQHCYFSVSDNGIGIPRERIPDAFGAFVRLGKRSGDGLGLALVKRNVELLGGKISCDSTVGEGTKFVVELPSTVHTSGELQ
ncbi:MAG: PAS domain-containing sensor histidine kinase [Pseudomonadota bacterium]